MYYDKEGKKIKDVLTWAKLFENINYKTIQRDRLKNGYIISTIWLGLDHRLNDKIGKPLIFETMVFGNEFDRNDEYQVRYSTLEEANAGHLKALKKFKGKFRLMGFLKYLLSLKIIIKK